MSNTDVTLPILRSSSCLTSTALLMFWFGSASVWSARCAEWAVISENFALELYKDHNGTHITPNHLNYCSYTFHNTNISAYTTTKISVTGLPLISWGDLYERRIETSSRICSPHTLHFPTLLQYFKRYNPHQSSCSFTADTNLLLPKPINISHININNSITALHKILKTLSRSALCDINQFMHQPLPRLWESIW
jgi:hypothetical protein